MTIGERIKLIREESNLSMAAFGDKIKIASSAISRMEKNQRTVTERTISLICNEFYVNERWLRTGEGEMYIADEVDELTDLYIELTHSDDSVLLDAVKKIKNLKPEQLAALNVILDGILDTKKEETT